MLVHPKYNFLTFGFGVTEKKEQSLKCAQESQIVDKQDSNVDGQVMYSFFDANNPASTLPICCGLQLPFHFYSEEKQDMK
jgi:hypothetical protein